MGVAVGAEATVRTVTPKHSLYFVSVFIFSGLHLLGTGFTSHSP